MLESFFQIRAFTSMAIAIAAVLNCQRSPFRIASPLVHDDPDEYNGIVADTMEKGN